MTETTEPKPAPQNIGWGKGEVGVMRSTAQAAFGRVPTLHPPATSSEGFPAEVLPVEALPVEALIPKKGPQTRGSIFGLAKRKQAKRKAQRLARKRSR